MICSIDYKQKPYGLWRSTPIAYAETSSNNAREAAKPDYSQSDDHETALHLVNPGGLGRRVMHMNRGSCASLERTYRCAEDLRSTVCL